jgi:hypothetical protein
VGLICAHQIGRQPYSAAKRLSIKSRSLTVVQVQVSLAWVRGADAVVRAPALGWLEWLGLVTKLGPAALLNVTKGCWARTVLVMKMLVIMTVYEIVIIKENEMQVHEAKTYCLTRLYV